MRMRTRTPAVPLKPNNKKRARSSSLRAKPRASAARSPSPAAHPYPHPYLPHQAKRGRRRRNGTETGPSASSRMAAAAGAGIGSGSGVTVIRFHRLTEFPGLTCSSSGLFIALRELRGKVSLDRYFRVHSFILSDCSSSLLQVAPVLEVSTQCVLPPSVYITQTTDIHSADLAPRAPAIRIFSSFELRGT